MAAIKQLASQTIWYGVSNIGARLLNYILTPLITYLLSGSEGVKNFGDYSLLYAWIAVANIVFTYGFETGFFRFSNKEGVNRKNVFETTFGSLILSTILLVGMLILFKQPIANFLKIDNQPQYITLCALLIGLDTIAVIPFAKLRLDERPKKYALIKLSGIMVNVLLVVLFLVGLPKYAASHPQNTFINTLLNNHNAVGFLIIANLIQNTVVFLLLSKEWSSFRFRVDYQLWKQIFKYSSPMIIIGLAGMINEVMDRQMLLWFLPLSEDDAKRIVGIYSANYKLAIFITLFISAFKMAAEPFFFDKAKEKNSKELFAKVMNWFVITMCIAFLFTTLFLDILQYIIGGSYRSGLGIVPILLGANICLGIYYNLSIWYKLTDKMRMGTYITLIGAAVTLIGNYFLIPIGGMFAAAWVTLLCYGIMVVITYFLGQKHFPVPYELKKIFSYLTVMLLLFSIEEIVRLFSQNILMNSSIGLVLFLCFFAFIFMKEKKELSTLPFIGKLIR